MQERELLINTLQKEKRIRKEVKNHPQSSVIFQPLIFFGLKYNQELAKLVQEDNEMDVNFIDFGKIGTLEKSGGQWIEKELERIWSKPHRETSLICFLNLNEISGTALEQSLLPFFDHHQNTQHRGIDLSNFILIATSSTSQLEKISPPLISRLRCVNQEEVKLSRTFLDKYYSPILVGSILIVISLLVLFFWLCQKEKKIYRLNHSRSKNKSS